MGGYGGLGLWRTRQWYRRRYHPWFSGMDSKNYWNMYWYKFGSMTGISVLGETGVCATLGSLVGAGNAGVVDGNTGRRGSVAREGIGFCYVVSDSVGGDVARLSMSAIWM